jgi:hypothetical protein
VNLEGSNARDLWVFGIKRIRDQTAALEQLQQNAPTVSSLKGRKQADIAHATPALRKAIGEAKEASEAFAV